MTFDLISLSQLSSIRHFLDYVLDGVDREFGEIEERRNRGEFASFEDLDHAWNDPMARLSIAVKAAMYETNALIESHLYRVAWYPWSRSVGKRPKSLLDIKDPSPYSLRSLEMVNDLPFGRVMELIESHYSIRLPEFPGWSLLMSIRDEVNAHKHRNGIIDFRRLSPDDMVIGQPYQIDRQKAYDGLSAAVEFLSALLVHTAEAK